MGKQRLFVLSSLACFLLQQAQPAKGARMLQVTFRDVLPSVEVLAPISAAHDALRALTDGRLNDACFSVTLTHCEDAERAPYRVSIELVTPAQATVVAVTEAHSLAAALRSGLSVAQASRPEKRKAASAPLAAVPSHEVHDSAWAVGA